MYYKYRFPTDHMSMKYLETIFRAYINVYLFDAIFLQLENIFCICVFSHGLFPSCPQLPCIKQDAQPYLIIHCTLKYFHSHNLPLISMNEKTVTTVLKQIQYCYTSRTALSCGECTVSETEGLLWRYISLTT